ncbi:hypothetical protein ACWDWV_36470 [Streptosporangium sandarakinum]
MTTDLRPETDLAELERHIAGAVTVLGPSSSPAYREQLQGRVCCALPHCSARS